MERCAANSSTELIGVVIRSIVNNAAKLAMYDEMSMNVKNHQTALTIRPDIEFGDALFACCINELNANQNEFNKLNLFGILAITWDDAVDVASGGMLIDVSPVYVVDAPSEQMEYKLIVKRNWNEWQRTHTRAYARTSLDEYNWFRLNKFSRCYCSTFSHTERG